MQEVVIFSGRASDLGVWAETHFAKCTTIEAGVLGLEDKGMSNEKESRFFTPCKNTPSNRAMGLVTSAN